MATAMQRTADIDFADVQGLVRFGHGKLKAAEFMLLEVADAAAARAWLKDAPVTTAEKLKEPPTTALQVAFTAGGLRALGVEEAIVAEFPQPYLAGMAGDESRSRRLGDQGPNDPACWLWGRPEPHVLLLLYAESGGLEAFKTSVRGDAFERGFREMHRLPEGASRGTEPFGFADGLSEPVVDWEGSFPTDQHRRLDYANMVSPGEMLLGYSDEYQEIGPRPLVDPQTPGAEQLPEAADVAGRRDLGRNGTFLVLRQLQQDVRGFWQYLDRVAGGDAQKREALATAMVGRHRDGRGLIVEERDIPGGKPGNNFTFDHDIDGYACPIGSHIRRANPRTGDHPPGVTGFWSWLLSTAGFRRRRDGLKGRHDLVASSRFHRLARRGRAYGKELSLEEALAPGSDEEQGLLFVCLCADLVRQFEFVQEAWIAGEKFNGLDGERDPLIGNREPLADGKATDHFSIPRLTGVTGRVEGLPQFVTVRGGAYFFMPGIRALHFIASRGG